MGTGKHSMSVCITFGDLIRMKDEESIHFCELRDWCWLVGWLSFGVYYPHVGLLNW